MDDFTKNIFPPPYSGPKPGNIIPDIFILPTQMKKDEGWGSFVLALSDDIIATLGEDWVLSYVTIFNQYSREEERILIL